MARLFGFGRHARTLLSDAGSIDEDPAVTPISSVPQTPIKKCFLSNLLLAATTVAVIAGFLLGFILRLRPTPWTVDEVEYIMFPGDLFLRMVRALILPLLISSLIAALGDMDFKLSGKVGTRTFLYCLATTMIAVFTGIVLTATIQPGNVEIAVQRRPPPSKEISTVHVLLNLLRNMFPPNIMEATIFQFRSERIRIGPAGNETMVTHQFHTPAANVIGLVVFSIVFGITISVIKEKGKPLYKLFASISDATMQITKWVIWLSPVGILFLICGRILTVKNFGLVFDELGLYCLTIILGLILHTAALCGIYSFFFRALPFQFLLNMKEAVLLALGTASSSACLPLTIRCLEKKNGVDHRIARFVVPIGATINMDGTAIFIAGASLFLAQLQQVPLDLGSILTVGILATVASKGVSGIPGAGIVTILMILDSLGLNPEDISLIFMVDWLLDRFRTVVNLLSDAVGAAVVNQLSLGDLKDWPDIEESTVIQIPQPQPETVNGMEPIC